jgi:molybdopterin molybdotransferase
MDGPSMIELNDALRIVLSAARPPGSEQVELSDALGRVLAEEVVADMDMPPFDKSLRDGYACRRADLGNVLTVIETIAAGAMPTREIGPHQCAKIMTGAALPRGADCVVMLEATEPAGANAIRVVGNETADYIARKAEDVRRGQVLVRKGSRVGPPQVAALASAGCVRPLVGTRPRIAVIASGSELVPAGAKPGPAQIRNTNGPQLLAQLEDMGLEPSDLGIAGDTPADIDRALKAALGGNDVAIISGGVSVGDFDFVPAVLRQNQVELLFEKIAVKPGKPTIFGRRGQTYCFGLPGNPVSTFVIFELLVKPFLYKLMGHEYSPLTVSLRLEEGVTRKDTDRQSWIPVQRTGAATVRPGPYHGSAHTAALCEADGLICLDIGVASIDKAATVDVRLLGRI